MNKEYISVTDFADDDTAAETPVQEEFTSFAHAHTLKGNSAGAFKADAFKAGTPEG